MNGLSKLNVLARRAPSGFAMGASRGPARVSVSGLGPLMRAFRRLPMLPVIILVALVFSLTIDGFISVFNVQNIMRQLSVILIAVSGETLVLLIGGIDLSVGAIISLASISGAYGMHFTGSAPLGVLVCLVVGIAAGALNGFGIARIGLQPFIMTFGMMLTTRAIAFLLTGGMSVGRLPKIVLEGGEWNVLYVPFVFLIGLLVAALTGLLLSRSVFGQKIYLTGTNPRAAIFSGVDVGRLTFQVYLIAGALSGFAAFVFMMRLGDAEPTAGDPLLLQVIGAAVLGGTSLTGGEGGITRSASGALLITMLAAGLDLLGAQFWDQMIVIGILIALGSALGTWLIQRRVSESNVPASSPARQDGGSGG